MAQPDESRDCYQAYDEAAPLLAEDFSLRLYRSGKDIPETERQAIQADNNSSRLEGTIVGGGAVSLSAYRAELMDRLKLCDVSFRIPEMAIRSRPSDSECARRYAAISISSRARQQRQSFSDRLSFAIRAGEFSNRDDSERPPQTSLNREVVLAEGRARSSYIRTDTDENRISDVLDLILSVQACDAKYDFPVMLVPGNVANMFGPPSEKASSDLH